MNYFLTQAFVDQIINSIHKIERNYQKNQGLILSEDDIKCILFNKIRILCSESRIETADRKIFASPIHTEIPFYNEDTKLRLKPDITIFDPRGMSLKHGMIIYRKDGRSAFGKLPSKGFEFFCPAIVIEIKFIKSKQGITKKNVFTIRKDIDKILNLSHRHNRSETDNNIRGIVVVFNKTNKVDALFDQLKEEYPSGGLISLVYATSNFVF